MSTPDRQTLRRLGALAVALAAVAASLVAVTVHGSMPYNAMSIPGERELQTMAWAPESWRFFTRDPQEENLLPYVLEGDGFRLATPARGTTTYAFGIDRAGRTHGMEVAMLIEGFPKSSFHACDDAPAECLARTTRIIRTKNRNPSPTLCGSVGVVLQKPVPWAWARSGKDITMPSRVVRLEVTC